MYTFILTVHIIVALLLIVVILLQIGRAGSLGGIFGGGGEQLFSTPSGSELLRKTTIVLAVAFLITSVSLTYVTYHRKLLTVMSRVPAMPPVQQPAAPAQGTPAQ